MAATRVSVQLGGECLVFTMAADGATLLEASRAAGLSLPASCEVGACSTCRARLVAGAVTLKNNFALDAEELAAGYVLCCQALPTSDEVALDFEY